MPVRPCLACGALTRKGSYCPAHRGTGARGSTWQWRRVREVVLARDRACVLCGSTQDLEVHHLVPKWQGGTDSLDNLEARCHLHHERGGT